MGKCAECRFWIKDEDDDGLGACHFDPPKILESTREEGTGYFGMWPLISEDDWCGKFQEVEDDLGGGCSEKKTHGVVKSRNQSGSALSAI